MTVQKTNQDAFLDDLEELCDKYSSGGMWEWRLQDEAPDGILFKYFYVDVQDTKN